jgi:hypothetical protein
VEFGQGGGWIAAHRGRFAIMLEVHGESRWR